MSKNVNECIERVEQAFDGLYSRQEVINILGNLDEFIGNSSNNLSELQDALMAKITDLEINEAIRKRNILNDQLKLRKNTRFFADIKDRGDFNIRINNFIDRVENNFKESLDDFTRVWTKHLQDEGVEDVLKDTKGIDNEALSRYLNEINQNQKLSFRAIDEIPREHQKTYKLAKTIAKMHRDFLQVKRDVGSNVRFLNGRIGKQSWSGHKISLDPTRFKKVLRDSIDWNKTSLEVDGKSLTIDEWIDTFTENNISGTWRDEFDLDMFSKKDLETPISKKNVQTGLEEVMASRRAVVIKPDKWNAVMEEFGTGNTFDTFLKEMEQTARSTSLIRELGTNPSASYEQMLSDLAVQRKDLGTRGRHFANNKEYKDLYRQLTGELDTPQVNSMEFLGIKLNEEQIAFLGSSARLFQGVGKLGLSAISAFSDILIPGIRRGSVFGNQKFTDTMKVFTESVANDFQQLVGIYGSKEAKRLAELQLKEIEGEFFHLSKMHRFGDLFQSSDFKPGVKGGLLASGFNKINYIHEKIFDLNPLGKWTEMRQAGTYVNIAREWGSIADSYGNFNKLPKHLQSYMQEIGLDEIWDTISPKVSKLEDGQNYLLKDVVNQMTDTEVEKYIKSTGGQMSIDAARRDLNLKYRSLLALENQRRVLMPGASTKAKLAFGKNRGTLSGEVVRNFAQFKSFAVDLWINVFNPAVQRNGLVNTFGTYIPAALMLSVAQNSLRDVVSGNTPRNFFDFSTEDKRQQAATNWAGSFGFALGLPILDSVIKDTASIIAGGTTNPRMATAATLSGFLGPANVEPIQTALEAATMLGAEDEEKRKAAFGRVATNAPVIGPALHGHVLGRAFKGNLLSGLYSFFDENHEDKLEDYAERQGSERLF